MHLLSYAERKFQANVARERKELKCVSTVHIRIEKNDLNKLNKDKLAFA